MNLRTTYRTAVGDVTDVRCPAHPITWIGKPVAVVAVDETTDPCQGACHPDVNQPVDPVSPTPGRGLTNADIVDVDGVLSIEAICDCGAVTTVPVGEPPTSARGIPVTCGGCQTVHWVTIVLVGVS